MKRIRTVFGGVAGSPWYSNMFFGDSQDGGTLVAGVSAFWADCASRITDAVSWTVQGVVPTIDPITGEITSSEDVGGINDAGTDTGEPLPYANQALVRWHTGAYIAGREVRGRTFIPGLTLLADDNGVLLASHQLAFTNAAETFIALGLDMLLWSRTHGETRIVTTADTWNQFAVLRSRRD